MFKKVRDTIRQSKFSKEEFPGKDLPGDIDSNATLNKKMEPCEELAGSQRPTSGPTTNSSATIISRTIKETPPEEVSTSQAGKNVTIMPDLNIPHENDAVTGAASTTERISRKARNAMPSKSVKSSSSLLTNGPRKSSTCNSTGTILRSATTGAVPRRHGLNNFADRPPLRTDDSVFSVGSLDDDTEVPDEGDNLDKSADSLSSSKLESDFPFTEPAAPNKDRRATALPSEYGARAAQRYATLEKWSDGEASDTERDHLDSVKDASSVFEEDTTAFRDSKSASATPSTATKSGNGGSTMRRTTALLLNRRGSCAQEAFGKLRRRNVKRFSVMAAVEIADKLRPAAYQDENFHHKGEDFDKGDTTPVKGTATPSTPGSLEFEFADKSKFHLKQIRTNGAFDFKCMGKEKLFKGKSILKGVAKFKENPDKYIAMTYQKKMLTWPKNMQEYTFIHRAGTERLVPSIISDDGWMSVLMQKYIHLPTFPNDELPVESRDQYSHKMTLRKQPFTKKFILPGRGMGVCDTPLLKVIGDIDPSDTHQGSIGDCWLLSAISALAEFDGAVKKLFRKTPRLTECPLLEANQYTITLWDLETWTEVDIVVDESLPADPLDDEKLLASQPSSDAELWVCYLEKAFAVHCGGWDEIVGGQCTHAWAMMTGCKHQYVIMKNESTGLFYCQARYNPVMNEWLDHHNSPHHPINDQGVWEVEWPGAGGGGVGHICKEELFLHMYAWDMSNYIVSAGSKKHAADAGIVDSHAYTVIEAVENVADTGINLMRVRNPWGKGEMQNGDFRDNGPGWEAEPKIKELLNPEVADDGIFWMTDKEFFESFDTIYVSASDMTDFLED